VTSNPVYVRTSSADSAPAAPAATTAETPVRSLFDGRTARGWSQESDAASLAAVDVAPLATGARLRLRFGLSGGPLAGQYAAAVVETAEAPMRISVQVRAEVEGAAPERWERSVFVDSTERSKTVRFDRMTPVGRTHTPAPPLHGVRAIMFVVDTTNTKPGASGRLWFGDVGLVREGSVPAEPGEAVRGPGVASGRTSAQVRTVSTR
jgi:hypothetical protein